MAFGFITTCVSDQEKKSEDAASQSRFLATASVQVDFGFSVVHWYAEHMWVGVVLSAN